MIVCGLDKERVKSLALHGIEPRLPEPQSGVIPLDHSTMFLEIVREKNNAASYVPPSSVVGVICELVLFYSDHF
jgi:hypothetical protein